jgi:hypothetical protein
VPQIDLKIINLWLSTGEVQKMIESVLQEQRKNRVHFCLLYMFPKLCHHQLHHQPKVQEHLLAATLGAFHDDVDESPFSFVFGGDSGSKYLNMEGNRSVLNQEATRVIADNMIRTVMCEKGYASQQIEEMLMSAKQFYEEADKMEIGQLLAIGVPESLLNVVAYQSKPYGIPTGKPLKEVVDAVSRSESLLNVDHQVRLILGRETMSPDSGIKVINVMDEKEVEAYCAGAMLGSPWEDPSFGKLMRLPEVDREGNAHEAFRDFLERLDSVIQKILILK